MGNDDRKRLVAAGYDAIADAYLERFGLSEVRDRKLAELTDGLPRGARVLDLGCGAGIPVVRDLTARHFDVTGVDGSARQIEHARHHVPHARFIHADMASVDFVVASFDAIAAFYSITHVPREEHGMLLEHIAHWLTPGGRFVGSFGAAPADDWTGDWLGTTMFFSHNDVETTKQLVSDAGLAMTKAEVVQQDNEAAQFLWIIAYKP